MNRTSIEKDRILEALFWGDENEGCLTTLNLVVGSVLIVLIFSVIGCLFVGLPWYLLYVSRPLKAIIGIVIMAIVWVVSGVILRKIFNSKTP